MATDTRRRMLAGAARMIGTHGAASMSLRDLARESDVPLGSTYHYFPEGKKQLVKEAVETTGRHVERLMDRAREDGVDAALGAFVDVWRTMLLDSDFRTSCPVLAVATEDDDEQQQTARAVFGSWQRLLTESLVESGVPTERAPRVARLVITSLEGAVALCRVEHSLSPLDDVATELEALLREAEGRPG